MKKGATLVFLDESGFSSTPYIAKTWAPRGKTPIVRHLFNWEKLSVISAITSHPRLYFRLYRGKAIRKEQVVQFLKLLIRHVRGKIVLLWDGVPQHRSKIVGEFLAKHPRIEVYRLPAYCPELNPDEWVWNYIKRRELPNLDVRDTSELAAKVRVAFRRTKRRPHLLNSILISAELPWDKEMLLKLRGDV